MHIKVLLWLMAAAIASGQTVSTVAGNGNAGFGGDGGQAAQAPLNRVAGLIVDPSGNLYLAEELNNRVRKIDTNGVITTLAGTGTASFAGDSGPAAQAQLNGPTGLCIAPAGEIYVNDQGNKRVRKISTSGTITTVAGNGSAVHSGDGGAATAAGMVIPIRCAVGAGGNLLIVDQGAHRLRKVTTGGTISTYASAGSQGFSGDGGAGTSAAMNSPTAIAFDGSGNVYVTDQSNQRIRRIDTSGTIQTVAGNGSISFSGDGGSATAASLNYPGGIALDSSGALYIVDTVNQRIRKVNGGNISTIAATGGTGFSGDGGGALQAQFNNPFPIALDAAGNIYIGDTGNNRVRQISGASGERSADDHFRGRHQRRQFSNGNRARRNHYHLRHKSGRHRGTDRDRARRALAESGRRHDGDDGWRNCAGLSRTQSQRPGAAQRASAVVTLGKRTQC
jgi:sugar lactone lactonase YvrE